MVKLMKMRLGKCLKNKQCDKQVRKCGIFIDKDYPFLAATLDGIVIGENALIEIKYLPSLKESGLSLIEACKSKKNNFGLELRDDGIKLKRKHDYYYQIQGQLNICYKDPCYFIVYIDSSTPVHVEKIEKDVNTSMCAQMVQELSHFYLNCFLPKIIDKNRK